MSGGYNYGSYSSGSGYQVPIGGAFGASFSSPTKDYGSSNYGTSYSYNTSTGTNGFPSSLNKPTTTTTSYSYGTPSAGTYTTPSTGTYGTSSYGTTGTTGGYSGLGGSYNTSVGLGYGQTQPSAGSGFGGAFGSTQPGSYSSYGTTTGGAGMGAGTTQPGGYALPSSYSSYSQPSSTGTYGLSSYGQPSTTQPGGYAQPASYTQPQPASNYGSYGLPPVPGKAFGKDELNDMSKAGKQLFSNAFSKTATEAGYDDVLKQLKASGQQYRDLDFPPELRSLTGGMSDYELQENYIQVDMKSIVWRRAEEIYGKGNFKVFQDNIEPGDIQQGALGDCYFLSTIAAIAENPDRIRKIFLSTEPNEQGCYAIKICDMGVWTTFLLDDYIPCSGKSKKPIFTDTNGPELWVALLEKAWAKVYGSYARIDAGLTRECLHDLTGAPTKYYLTGDSRRNEEIWKDISFGEQKNFVMTCGSGDLMDGADLMSSVGLVGSHAYSLLAALTVKDKYGKDIRLVKIRNPWGQGEWKGEWSDQSASWTPELRRQLKMENRDDGTFFMSYDDMLKYFTDIQICKVHDDFKYKSLKASTNHIHAAFFKVTVKTSGHYYITINQESTRKHAEKENYRYSKVRVVFGRKVGDGYQYVEGITKADKEVWTDGHMDAGEYIVYAKIAWNEQKTKEFSISSYGAGEVDIEKIDESQCEGFIEKVYMNKGKSMKVGDYSSHGVSNCFRGMELTDDGFGFIYYKNESNKTLEEDFYFKSMTGFKLKKPYKGNNFKITVPPGQERVVILKQLPNATGMSHNASAISKFT